MSPAEAVGSTMREFGNAETCDLLHTAVKAIGKAADDPSEEHVHKMRVSIRRLQQGLRLFRQFLKPKGVREVRSALKRIMEPAGELRNLDIALTLTTSRGDTAAVLRYRRQHARAVLAAAVAETASGNVEDRWRRRLGLPGESA